MNLFTNAVINTPDAQTWNGAAAFSTTHNACVNLFYAAGASRGKNISHLVTEAYKEDRAVTLQILQWLRDCRGGAGERTLYRQAIKTLFRYSDRDAEHLVEMSPKLGRWDDAFDDLLTWPASTQAIVVEGLKAELENGNALLAKWLPRKGEVAVFLTKAFGWTPKQYRKTIVNLTKVVETQMCANQWPQINYEHVPSLAAARYQKAFAKHDPTRYDAYRKALVAGAAKINAGAVFPYDVIKAANESCNWDVAQAQWDSIKLDFDGSMLPMVDVSGSMTVQVTPKSKLRAIDVAVSLGLFLSERNRSAFKDIVLTFSAAPQIKKLHGSLCQKFTQLHGANWEMNTNLSLALKAIIELAVDNQVPQEDMPDSLLILSDMQFDACVNGSGLNDVKKQFTEAGYKVPNVIFWNLNHDDNFPTVSTSKGVAMVSGFSPAIVKNLTNLENCTPERVMLDTVGKYPVPNV